MSVCLESKRGQGSTGKSQSVYGYIVPLRVSESDRPACSGSRGRLCLATCRQWELLPFRDMEHLATRVLYLTST